MESDPFSEFQREGFSVVSTKGYDAFINHRGPDIKESVASEIYNCVQVMGYRPFLDQPELQLGDPIPSTIQNAINTSTVQISIFSPRYAESQWCLDELLLMLKTKARFIPVFFDVKPSDLRYPHKGVYGRALGEHEEKGRFSNERLQQWKEALKSSSFLCGYNFSTSNGNVKTLCRKIALAVKQEVENTRCMEVAKYPVGLDDLVEDFERQTARKGNIVGIFAMGGSGKTTLAKELFNRKRWSYHGSSFIFDVREASARDELTCLQSQLLRDLFLEERKFMSKSEGKSFLKQRMRRSRNRFLIVLDDVDDHQQLDALLLRDALNSGSLVIVTTRDESVLTRAGITRHYILKEMKRGHAKELFCRHALGLAKAPTGYEKLVDSFVQFCGGLPLAIQVSAATLLGIADVNIWRSELQKFKSTLNLEIKTKLGISLGRLDREQKQIFMDIACFFIGKLVSIGVRIWKGSGWNTEHTIQTLKDKCLLEIRRGKPMVGIGNGMCEFQYDGPSVFQMHDLLRDLGREMAREIDAHASPLRLWRPRDLKFMEKKGFKNILTETKDKKIRCFNSIFDLSMKCQITYFLGNSDDRDLALTDLLWIELQVNGLEWTSIPSWIPLENLQCLRIIGGHLQRLWQKDDQVPFELKELLLHRTSSAEFPNELRKLHNLEKLVLQGSFTNLPVIDGKSLSETLGKLGNLKSLVLVNCELNGDLTLSSSGYPESEYKTGICNKLKTVGIHDEDLSSEVLDHWPRLKCIVLDSLKNLSKVHLWLVKPLNRLKFKNCRRLKSVSGKLDQGKHTQLIISNCPRLQKLPRQLVSYLNSIEVDRLISFNANKDLKGIDYLHLSNGKVKKYRTYCSKLSKILSMLSS
ncbi:hypothetical protein SUGI_0027090 [Cryptomeria japonica]|nr:hypothetical protein SUGI_0027090 [Cryptomeria japonica]